MEKRRFRLAAAVLAAMLSLLTGCQKFKDIRITSVKVETLDVKGMKGADIRLAVGIHNPSVQITVSEIEGTVKHSGKVLGSVAMAPLVIKARTDGIYHAEATVSIAEGISFRDLMKFADPKRLDECTVDFKAKAKIKGGGTKRFAVNDIPLKKLLESAENEKI